MSRKYEASIYNLYGRVIAEIVIKHKEFEQYIDKKEFGSIFCTISNEKLEKLFIEANKWANERLEIMNKHSK